uniref:Uncharacterized protein n=1 Tax=Romanomermis culicivorax TaxID=13658 RepID=A0A915KCE3_ROMCU
LFINSKLLRSLLPIDQIVVSARRNSFSDERLVEQRSLHRLPCLSIQPNELIFVGTIDRRMVATPLFVSHHSVLFSHDALVIFDFRARRSVGEQIANR